jgi:predicted ABC-type ATPase
LPTDKPSIFALAGSNGAGKSTLGDILLPDELKGIQIFDGDKYYSQRRNHYFNARYNNKESRNKAEDDLQEHFQSLVDDVLVSRSNFAYEGHFTGESQWQLLSKFKASGFNIHMVYLGLENLEASHDRVNSRIAKAGFYVPPSEVEKNYFGNLKMLNQNFSILDGLDVFDTTYEAKKLLNIDNNILTTSIDKSAMPGWVKTYLPNIVSLMPIQKDISKEINQQEPIRRLKR